MFFFLVLVMLEVKGKDFLVETEDNNKEFGGNYSADGDDLIESTDYAIAPKSNTKHEAVGSKTTLRCESPVPFNDCKFKAPNGEVHRIGIGGGSSYDRARVDCLCTEEEYDPTKVCGIYIKDLTKEDTGAWTCEMEFKKYGRETKKTATTILQVGEPGESEPVSSIDNSGEYIQKPEIELKPGNLIKVLPGIGSEYKIIFDLLITKLYPYSWSSVLMFTADTGLNGLMKYGDRTPALYVDRNKKLFIASGVSGNPNLHTNVPATVGKWMKLEICQHTINNKLTFEVKINRKSVYKTEQKKPCLFKGVKVFAGQPWSAYPVIEGKIKNLYYETSDKTNNGKCALDFTPTPMDPNNGLLQGPELDLKKNQLLTVLPYIGREYVVTFELYLNSYTTAPWASILHFTTQGNSERYGNRNPAVWMSGHKDHYRLLHVSSSIDGNINMWIDPKKIPPLKTWIKIRISQTLIDNKFIYEVKVNDKSQLKMPNTVPSMFTDVKVYAGDPWYPAQDGKIRNLVVVTENDNICICKAANCKNGYGYKG